MSEYRLIYEILETTGGVFCLICALYILVGETINTKRCRVLMYFLFIEAAQQFGDAAAWHYDGVATNVGVIAARIGNYTVQLCNPLMGIIAVWYLDQFVAMRGEKISRRWKYMIYLICTAGLILVNHSQFTSFIYGFNEQNIYYRGPGFVVISVIDGLMLVGLITMTIAYRRYMKPIQYGPLLTLLILPIAAIILQVVTKQSLTNVTMLLAVAELFLFYEVERSKKIVDQQQEIWKREIEIVRQQAEMSEKKTQIMLSQIQPHFIYNTLGSIEVLCDRNPKLAKSAIHHFARFFRMNMTSLDINSLIPFEKELEHTKNYLWIEELRFEDELTVEYDLQERNFKLPAMTLLPIVEYAVSNGICEKIGGGTVRISSMVENRFIILKVEDDGEGVETEKRAGFNRRGNSLDHVAERLKILCGGTIETKSTPGKGTVTTVRIPMLQAL